MHNFLSMISLGKLPMPPEFLIEFEKTQLAHVIGLDRRLKMPQEISEIKDNPSLLSAELEQRKNHITMLVSCFVFSKVFTVEVFNSANAVKTHFSTIPKTESVYFNFYGFTMVALLTDLLYKRFENYLTESNPGKPEISVKHMLFEALLEPMNNKNTNFNYSTFRYGKERESRWKEMEDYFSKMLA